MKQPADYLKLKRAPALLSQAVAVLIGVGIGCDEAGDEPDNTALPKLRAMQKHYLSCTRSIACRPAKSIYAQLEAGFGSTNQPAFLRVSPWHGGNSR
jgi:hypothetical protein